MKAHLYRGKDSGKFHLEVNGVTLATEGDLCRDKWFRDRYGVNTWSHDDLWRAEKVLNGEGRGEPIQPDRPKPSPQETAWLKIAELFRVGAERYNCMWNIQEDGEWEGIYRAALAAAQAEATRLR